MEGGVRAVTTTCGGDRPKWVCAGVFVTVMLSR